jgi:hypothetical protein
MPSTTTRQQRRPSHTRSRRHTMAWRNDQRAQSLQLFTERSKHLIWSPALLRLLLEELWIEDELVSLIGAPGRLSVSRYPQAIAVALALRHSWRPDDLRGVAKRLGISDLNL